MFSVLIGSLLGVGQYNEKVSLKLMDDDAISLDALCDIIVTTIGLSLWYTTKWRKRFRNPSKFSDEFCDIIIKTIVVSARQVISMSIESVVDMDQWLDDVREKYKKR